MFLLSFSRITGTERHYDSSGRRTSVGSGIRTQCTDSLLCSEASLVVLQLFSVAFTSGARRAFLIAIPCFRTLSLHTGCMFCTSFTVHGHNSTFSRRRVPPRHALTRTGTPSLKAGDRWAE